MYSENSCSPAEAVKLNLIPETEQSFSYDHLPLEIIIKIYGYLPLHHIQNASLASRHWYSASMDSTVLKKKVLRINDKVLPDLMDETATEIMDSILPYESIKISCNSDKRPIPHCLTDMNFWKRMAKSLKFLDIDQVHDGHWHNILEVLGHLENLESLCLNFNKIEEIWPRNTNKSLPENIKLKKLTFIDLHVGQETQYLLIFLEMIPEIIHFYLTIAEANSCVYHHLFHYLNLGKKRIKTLYLNAEPDLIRFILTLREMNLETIAFYDPSNNFNIRNLQQIISFTNQTKLLRLTINFITDYNNFSSYFCIFVHTFPNLQRMVLDGSNYKPQKNPAYLKSAVNNQSILQILVLNRPKVRYISQQICLPNINFKNMGNLTSLLFSYVERSLSDEALQCFFKYLTLLKHIRICSSSKYNENYIITDYGFTGERGDDQNGYSISNLIFLESLDFKHVSSRLGDPTLMHISKLKQLRYLHIFCKEGSELAAENLRKSCPLLKIEKIRLVKKISE